MIDVDVYAKRLTNMERTSASSANYYHIKSPVGSKPIGFKVFKSATLTNLGRSYKRLKIMFLESSDLCQVAI